MRRPEPHALQRIFVAEGDKLVRRLLESEFAVVSLLILEPWVKEFAPLLAARPEDIPVFVPPKPVMEQLVGFPVYQGAMAVGRFPAPPSLDVILRKTSQPHLVVAVDGIANAENLGVIVRNCAAFGAHALIVGETSSTPYLRRAVRNSMGAIFKLPAVETPNLVETLRQLRGRGIRCIAAHGQAKSRTLAQCDLTSNCCIVLGGEGHGVSPAVLKECDELAAIPMANEVDSLNVSNAAAVFLYEANRQRNRM
jgi:tRNA G18 (ribose-2'-O)-methylase SpoU